MGDHQDTEAERLPQVEQQGQDLAPDRGVERRDRLVGHDQLGRHRQRARDQHPLPLAAGQLVRVAQEQPLGGPQPGRGQRRRDELRLAPALAVGALEPVQPDALGDRLVDRVPGVERAGRVLEHELDAPTERPQPPRGALEGLPVEQHLAGGGLLEAQQGAGERGLARARLAHQRDDLPRRDAEVDAVHRPRDRAAAALEADAEAAGLEGGRAGLGHRGSTSRQAAARLVAVRAQLGHDRVAVVEALRAARVERAARRQLGRVGRVAGQPRRGVPGGHVADPGEGRRQGAGVGVQRVGEDLVGGPVLDHAPGVHHGDPVAEVGQHRQVVADHQQPDVEVADQSLEHVEHLGLHHHVEGGGGLVGDDQAGPAGQRHRDHDALPLAAGELVGVGPGALARQPDLLEQLTDARLDRLRRQVRLVEPDGFGDLGPDALDGVERVQRALEDHRRPGPAQRAQRAPLHRLHVLALEEDATGDAGARRLQPQDRRGQGGLAAARLPRDADHLAGGHRQRDTADGGYVATRGPVGDRDVVEAAGAAVSSIYAACPPASG